MPHPLPHADQDLPPATLRRRLLAMLYDGLICVALVMVVTMIYTLLQAQVMGVEQYKALAERGAVTDPLLTSVLFVSLFLFFAYFWTRSGQTLGMQAWRIRVQNPDGTAISWTQALLRFMMGWLSWAPAGLGYFWMLFDPGSRTWTDRFSESQVVQIPKS